VRPAVGARADGRNLRHGVFFWRLDKRNEELVNYGKAALHVFETAIFEKTWPPIAGSGSSTAVTG
jgi:hypothetical protein